MSSTFQLPPDGTIYADSIFSRCRDLIGYQIWSGLQGLRLDSWIANFQSPEERYFAARVLDALVYRSDDQTTALMHQLLCRVVPDQSRINRLPNPLRTVYTSLRDPAVDPRVRVVPVMPPKARPTKSGLVIARQLKRALRTSEQWILNPDEVSSQVNNVDAFIFVDDFLGTGNQFSDFLNSTGLNAYVSQSCFVYGCLAGHAHGINALQNLFPSLSIAAVECLDDNHALFDEKAGSFPDGINSPESARDFYYDLLADRGIDTPNRSGYGHLELVYAFEHSIPDNSLPILWYAKSSQWKPLFDR